MGGTFREWGRGRGTPADDPMLLTAALPQRDHLPPQDLVLPGEKAWRVLRHLESSLGHHPHPQNAGLRSCPLMVGPSLVKRLSHSPAHWSWRRREVQERKELPRTV